MQVNWEMIIYLVHIIRCRSSNISVIESFFQNGNISHDLVFINDTEAVISYLSEFRTMSDRRLVEDCDEQQRIKHVLQSSVIILNLGGTIITKSAVISHVLEGRFEIKSLTSSAWIQIFEILVCLRF